MIRWRQSADDKAIVELVRTQLVPISPWHHPRDSRLSADIDNRLRRGPTLVASRSRNSSPFAFLHMELQGATLLIDLLAVDGSYQNKHWGSELMNRAEQFGREQGCTTARVYVDESNSKGLRFYQRLGYTKVSHIKQMKVVELMKPLDQSNQFWV
jgi:GNAT superfamily N-acetyltransferase